MCPLTKEQRLAAYEYALEEIIKFQGLNMVICKLLDKYSTELTDDMYYTDWFYSEVRENYPEFYRQKPTAKQLVSVWWTYTPQGKAARIRALKAAIELTKSI